MSINCESDDAQARSWRDVLPVHPAADLFPMMTADELKALGEDIKRHNMKVPIVIWSPSPTDADKNKVFLLDGRNRLDAMEAVGMNPIYANSWKGGGIHQLLVEYQWLVGIGSAPCDPYEFVISANIHRRHLTGEQARDLIAKLLKANPEKSDRQIAEQIEADHKTVAKVRPRKSQLGKFPS